PDVGDLRFHDVGLPGAGVEQELVDLVRTDVAEDAAVLVGIPEPSGSGRAAAGVAMALNNLVGGDVDGLDDLADGTLLDQLACVHGSLHLEPLAVHDSVDAAGFGD